MGKQLVLPHMPCTDLELPPFVGRKGLVVRGTVESWALFDSAMRYRYALGRCWEPGGPMMLVKAMNPSTADHEQNDPTITRVVGRARRANAGSVVVVNCYGFRSTYPRDVLAELQAGRDAVGVDNDAVIDELRQHARWSVAAWGKPKWAVMRTRMTKLPDDWLAWELTKEGYPRHPLYLSNNAALRSAAGLGR